MKRITITLVLMLLLSSCATTGDYFSWDETNTKLHVPLTLLILADLRQTLDIAKPDYSYSDEGVTIHVKRKERNPAFNEQPSRKEVYTKIGLAYVGATLLTWKLDPPWSHRFQIGVIAGETASVGYNIKMGYGVEF